MSEEKTSPKVIRAIIGAEMLSLCGVVVETAMNITSSTLTTEFGINISTVQQMATIYLLVVASAVSLSAYLRRSFKTKSVLLATNLLFILGALTGATAPGFTILLFGCMVRRIGVGIVLPLMLSIILGQVSVSKIGVTAGVGASTTAVASAVGPTFGGSVAPNLDWHFIFVLLIPLLLVSSTLDVASIEQKDEMVCGKPDILSVIAIFCAFISPILGINNLADYDFLSLSVPDSLFASTTGLVVLVRRSAQLAVLIAELSILKNGRFAGRVVTPFLFQIVNLGLSFLIPDYVQLINHSTSTIVGLLAFPGASIGAYFAPFSGSILDRSGAKRPIIFRINTLTFALCPYSIFGLHLSDVWLTAFYILSTGGVGIAFGNVMISGQKQVVLKERIDANTVFNTLQQLAGAAGTIITSLIITLGQTNSSPSYFAATAQGSRDALIILLILTATELVILL